MSNYEAVKRILRQIDPSASFRPQFANEWRGGFALPDTLLEYFRVFGPVDLTIKDYGNPCFLPSLARLWLYQEGYRYDGNTHERFPDWDDDWLAIADKGADPFILSISHGVIFHAFHGEGTWEPVELFTGLPEMVNTFSVFGRMVAMGGSNFTNPDSTIRDEFKNGAQQAVLELTDSSHRAGVILERLGWS